MEHLKKHILIKKNNKLLYKYLPKVKNTIIYSFRKYNFGQYNPSVCDNNDMSYISKYKYNNCLPQF